MDNKNGHNGHNGNKNTRKVYKRPKEAAHRRAPHKLTHSRYTYPFPNDLLDGHSKYREEKHKKEFFGGPGF